MSDQEKAAGGQDPITRTIDGKEVTFAELSFSDRRDLIRKSRETEKLALISFLNETDADVDTRRQELAVFLNEKSGEQEWHKFFNSDDGKIAIMEKSLSKAGNANAVAVAAAYKGGIIEIAQLCAAITHTSLDPVITVAQAQKLINEAVRKARGEDVEGSGSPNPTQTVSVKKGLGQTVGFGKL